MIGSAGTGRIGAAPRGLAFLVAGRSMLALVVLGALPVVLWAVVMIGSQHQAFGIEFVGNFFRPAQDILAGNSPYHAGQIDAVITAVREGHPPAKYQSAVYPSYPPPALLVGVPLTVLGITVAGWLWAALLTASAAASLALLGVRDWRCYGAAAGSITLLSAVMLGSTTPLLMLAAAVIWRWRDNPRVVALALGGAIALKLIMWPLLIWLWASGRRAQAIAAFSFAFAACAVGWAIIGFPSLSGYAHLLSSLASLEGNRGYSLVRIGHLLGASSQTANIASYVVGAALLLLLIVFTRRSGDERRAFTLALIASLALTPIVWQQYFAILLVPIALSRPRLDGVWLVPLAFWLAPENATDGHPMRVVFTGAVVLFLIATLLRPTHPTAVAPTPAVATAAAAG